MFKAMTVPYDDLPSDVNGHIFGTCEIGCCDDYLYDDYLVVQADGKTIYCKPESKFEDDMEMTAELMELAYYLGVVAGIRHEQGFMEGRTLQVLDGVK